MFAEVEEGVEHLANAIAIYGQPQQLMQVFAQSLPQEVLQLLALRIPIVKQVSLYTLTLSLIRQFCSRRL